MGFGDTPATGPIYNVPHSRFTICTPAVPGPPGRGTVWVRGWNDDSGALVPKMLWKRTSRMLPLCPTRIRRLIRGTPAFAACCAAAENESLNELTGVPTWIAILTGREGAKEPETLAARLGRRRRGAALLSSVRVFGP